MVTFPPMMRQRFRALFATLLLAALATGADAGVRLLPLLDGEEISVETYPADGEFVLLFFAPEYGLRAAHRELARDLSAAGVTVWLADLHGALFLPYSAEAVRGVDGRQAARLVVHARRETGRRVIVAGDAYGAVLALRAAHFWQRGAPESPDLAGAVLFSPYAYTRLPSLGLPPEYLPVVAATSTPVLVYQATGSGTTNHLETLVAGLSTHGPPVRVRDLPGLASLFYREPPSDAMRDALAVVAGELPKRLAELAATPTPTTAAPMPARRVAGHGLDVRLVPYRGAVRAQALRLRDDSGAQIERLEYSGRVTLVNFWATWCPPCVEEIPSLNRLIALLDDPRFEVLAIDYAEPAAAVRDFKARVDIRFPVLLDSDGEVAKAWRVVSFPSTFVIGKDGVIRYGVNAALAWDAPEVVAALRVLLDE